MKRSPLLDRITLNPEICHGKPTIRNTRYMVSAMLDYMAGGDSIEDLIEEFPGLERDDFRACIAYANLLLVANENKVVVPLSV
ncbi:MAG: DUF433 domain-containing protein [Bacteroidota bacterium]